MKKGNYMTKKEVIEKLAKEKVIESITNKFKTKNKNDLIQYIYLYLLEMDEDKFMELYNTKRLNYYLVGLIRHQVISTTSYHIKNNVAKSGIYELDAIPIYEESNDYLLDDNTIPHEYEDKVDAALSALTPQEREMILLFKIPLQYKKPAIEKYCKKYNMSYTMYQHQLPILKVKFAKLAGIKYNPCYQKTRTREINQYDTQMNLIHTWSNAYEAAQTLDMNTDGIYKCCQGKRQTYRGYIWKYVKK